MTRAEAIEILHETIVSAKHDPEAPPLSAALEALRVLAESEAKRDDAVEVPRG